VNLSYIDEIYCVSKCRARKIRIPIQNFFQPISLVTLEYQGQEQMRFAAAMKIISFLSFGEEG
jgi:hypothetical protein